ncbi:ester cyclase [Jiella avicenniae]|uniref:ester cyclase n=1 Tax=Jiella avicenniae TaxID=2907202 RepID=UPI0030844D78
MAGKSLSEHYLAYIACLTRQDWAELERFVDDDVRHNGRHLGLSGYRDMLVKDFHDIPDLRFRVDLLVCEDVRVAARLLFDRRPRETFLGLKVDGRRVSFAESVFYEFEAMRINSVWSILDKSAIEAQPGAQGRVRARFLARRISTPPHGDVRCCRLSPRLRGWGRSEYACQKFTRTFGPVPRCEGRMGNATGRAILQASAIQPEAAGGAVRGVSARDRRRDLDLRRRNGGTFAAISGRSRVRASA